MRYQGKVTGWNDAKGYGFVTPHDAGRRAFVHIKAFGRKDRRPVNGDIITYEERRDAQGRSQADDIKFLRVQKMRPEPSGSGIVVYLIIAAISTALFILVFVQLIPFVLASVYIIASGVTFMAYGFDKAAAIKGKWRTQESTLHLLSLVGGWPGALVAQHVFHHKSKKAFFQLEFLLTVITNVIAVAGFLMLRSSVFHHG